MADFGGPTRHSIPSNIYTVLTAVAAAALLVGVVYVAWRNMDMFGSILPLG